MRIKLTYNVDSIYLTTRLEAPSRVPLPSFQLIYKDYVSSCIWLSTFILIG